MKAYIAGSILLMSLFFQCSMDVPKKPRLRPKSNSLVSLEADEITNPERIERFLRKLDLLKKSNGDSLIKIVHIGDSHIQMGYFSGEVRNALQAKFGGEGIGFFFPNGLCAGFNPLGLDISSPSNWTCEKITSLKPVIPIGITGMAMKTEDKESILQVSLRAKNKMVGTFKIFHENIEKTYDITCENAIISTEDYSPTSAITTITMQKEVDTAFVKFTAKAGVDKPLIIYGLSVNSPANKGIDYNTFGVSGGQYKYFAKNTPLLSEQMAILKPDLMIISLGSNDSYDKTLTKEEYKNMLRNFIVELRRASPLTEFILTTPPDTKFKDSNPASGNIVNQSIIEIGQQANCAVWDFYKVMGGYGSVKNWRKKDLSNKDGLHLTTEGYYLQGQLFNLALSKAMEQKYPGNGWLEESEEILLKTLK